MTLRTQEEEFWAGQFGDEYIDRNSMNAIFVRKIWMFTKILAHVQKIESVLELGANIGLNLRALRTLLPSIELHAVEINEKAFGQLRQIEGINALHGSVLDFDRQDVADLTFTAGVLIHINPDEVDRVYQALYTASKRYIMVSEYYNPTFVEVPYRGHSERMYKRDWVGDLLTLYPDLQLIDYGFFSRWDPICPGGDENWFLLEKRRSQTSESRQSPVPRQ